MHRAIELSLAVFVVFLVHDFLQEKIVVQEGFSFGMVMTLVEFLSLAVLPVLKSALTGSAMPRFSVGHARELSSVAVVILVAILCSNLAVNFVHYPIKVALKSGKLIPTMAIGTLIIGKRQSLLDYVAAVLLCSGLCGFTLTDYFNMSGDEGEHERASNDLLFGCGLLITAISFEAALPTLQEKLMKADDNPVSPEEMLMHTNMLAAMLVFVAAFAQGEVQAACGVLTQDQPLCFLLGLYATSTYIGVTVYTHLIKEVGGAMAVVVTTLRKVGTIALSFVVFPDGKPFSGWYLLWGTVVVAGVLVGAKAKEQRKALEQAARAEVTSV